MVPAVTWQSNPPEKLLKERFHISTGFHPGQRDIIEQIIQGKRLLVIQRTMMPAIRSICGHELTLFAPIDMIPGINIDPMTRIPDSLRDGSSGHAIDEGTDHTRQEDDHDPYAFVAGLIVRIIRLLQEVNEGGDGEDNGNHEYGDENSSAAGHLPGIDPTRSALNNLTSRKSLGL